MALILSVTQSPLANAEVNWQTEHVMQPVTVWLQ